MSISRFIIYFILFIFFLAIPPLVAQFFFPIEGLLIPKFWLLFWIFAILTFSIYSFAYWRMSISINASGQALLGSITIKLLICTLIAFLYISENTVDPIKFIINFFYLYFLHTVFEIYCLLCNLHNPKIK
jgi:hypothetical protein